MEKHESPPVSEMIKSIPAAFGIRLNEEPEYQVFEKDGDFEVRCYEAITLAQVKVLGDFETFKQTAFQKLADYLFGKNSEHKKMNMTQPVFLEKINTATWAAVPFEERKFEDHPNAEWMMSFVLPKEYDSVNAPKPLDSDITLTDQTRSISGVLTYTGNNEPEKMQENAEKLMRWLNHSRDYQMISAPISAGYDQPATVPFLKRNEIHIALTPVQDIGFGP